MSKRKSDPKKGQSQSSGDDVVEVSLLVVGRALEEVVVTASSAGFLGVEEEAPGGGVTEEIGQLMQDVQFIPPAAPLATRDPEAPQPLAS
ncbi:hypothetical protein ACB092_12G192000 [Castanea dentata]